MGRLASSPPSDHRAAGFTLLSVVGMGRHIMPSEDAASPSQLRDPSRRTFDNTTLGFAASCVPTTGSQGSKAVRPCPENLCSLCSLGHLCLALFAPSEGRAV